MQVVLVEVFNKESCQIVAFIVRAFGDESRQIRASIIIVR